ncbi:MAG: polymer-forming cytoskeletal protein [Oscillospiraceae bacterium]
MSAKDNFAQAFKELLNGSENATPNTDTIPQPDKAAPMFGGSRPVAPVQDAAPAQSTGKTAFGGFSTSHIDDEVPPRSSGAGDSFATYEEPAGVTTIAKGTVVVGEIHSKGDINLFGEIKGNVETIGNVQIGGRVMGNVGGNDMVITSSAVKGNVAATGILQMDGGSVVMGDLKASEAHFDGQVKGNLTVDGLAHFFSDTVLLGNVTVGSLIIDEGARLRGEICTGSRDRFDIADPFQN